MRKLLLLCITTAGLVVALTTPARADLAFCKRYADVYPHAAENIALARQVHAIWQTPKQNRAWLDFLSLRSDMNDRPELMEDPLYLLLFGHKYAFPEMYSSFPLGALDLASHRLALSNLCEAPVLSVLIAGLRYEVLSNLLGDEAVNMQGWANTMAKDASVPLLYYDFTSITCYMSLMDDALSVPTRALFRCTSEIRERKYTR